MRHPLFSLGVAVSTLFLAGCATMLPGATDSPKATLAPPQSTAPVAPSPSVPAVDPADLSTWTIDAAGVGPARLGMPIDDAVRAMAPALMLESPPEGCSMPTLRFLSRRGPASPAGGFAPDEVMLVPDLAGKLAEIMLAVAGPSTVDHLGVGSTVSEVMAAYPDAEASLRGTRDPLLTVAGDPGSISFESNEQGATAAVRFVWLIEGHATPYPEYCGS